MFFLWNRPGPHFRNLLNKKKKNFTKILSPLTNKPKKKEKRYSLILLKKPMKTGQFVLPKNTIFSTIKKCPKKIIKILLTLMKEIPKVISNMPNIYYNPKISLKLNSLLKKHSLLNLQIMTINF